MNLESSINDTPDVGENADEDVATAAAARIVSLYSMPLPTQTVLTNTSKHGDMLNLKHQAAQNHSQGVSVDLSQLFGAMAVGSGTHVPGSSHPGFFSPPTSSLLTPLAQPSTLFPGAMNFEHSPRFPMNTLNVAGLPTGSHRSVLGSAQETQHLARRVLVYCFISTGQFRIFSPNIAYNGSARLGATASGVGRTQALTQSRGSLASVQSPPVSTTAPGIRLCQAWKSFKLDRSKLQSLCT